MPFRSIGTVYIPEHMYIFLLHELLANSISMWEMCVRTVSQVEEVVKGIDAVSRQILARLTIMLGMQKLKVPLPIMGAGSWLSMVPLSPKVTTEDRYIIANGRCVNTV